MHPLPTNGVAGRAPHADALPFGKDDPLEAVLRMGRDATRVVAYALLCAVLVHTAFVVRAELIPLEMMLWARGVSREVHYRLYETYEIDLLKPLEPAPAPPAPEPVKEEPKEAPPPAPVKDVTTPPAAPAAARAGAVLTAAPDPDAPAVFDGFISGTSETFSGGASAANGTSDTAVRVKPGVSGVPGGTGTAPTGPAAVDRSRVANTAGSRDWNCPFPAEADVDQIDQAFPSIQVTVRADGSPERAVIVSDPGHGFGRAAVSCAMRQRFEPALDRDGSAIPGLTKAIRVRFER